MTHLTDCQSSAVQTFELVNKDGMVRTFLADGTSRPANDYEIARTFWKLAAEVLPKVYQDYLNDLQQSNDLRITRLLTFRELLIINDENWLGQVSDVPERQQFVGPFNYINSIITSYHEIDGPHGRNGMILWDIVRKANPSEICFSLGYDLKYRYVCGWGNVSDFVIEGNLKSYSEKLIYLLLDRELISL